jgi:hypothetical protein
LFCFRQRNGSFKRPRVEGGAGASIDGYYDLSRDATTTTHPTGLKVDTGKIRELMVKANEAASAIRSRFVSDLIPEEVRDLASFSMNLLDLMNAVVEGGILPMSAPPPASFASAATTSLMAPAATNKPRVEPGTAELKAALMAADKAAVVFDADLGVSTVFLTKSSVPKHHGVSFTTLIFASFYVRYTGLIGKGGGKVDGDGLIL